MKIALDYDETFTADPELWAEFVRNATKRGHLVLFVTFRNRDWPNFDIEQHAEMLGIGVLYSGGRQKAHICDADIWIDDSPLYIPTHADMVGMVKGCERMGDTESEVA